MTTLTTATEEATALAATVARLTADRAAYADAQRTKNAARTAAAIAGAATLEGSEKQVARAEKIRSKFLASASGIEAEDFLYENSRLGAAAEKAGLDDDDAVTLFLATAKAVTSAAWWIDSRDHRLGAALAALAIAPVSA